MTGRLTVITSRHIDGKPKTLQCGHAIPRGCYDESRHDEEAYSCAACRREWSSDVLSGRFGDALRALMPERDQGVLLL
mgnify:FL=1|jgi:hypothetical protein